MKGNIMRTRQLGNTDINLTTIGFGTWAIGGSGWQYGWGPQDDKESIQAIIRAVELGVNWIDTAAVYGLGHSEEVVGKAVKELEEEIIIATKCGRGWNDDGTIFGRLSKESVKQECEDSLRRLDIERIDLYQIHWPDPEEYIEEAWEAMSELVQEGKVKYGGVSNFSPEQIERIAYILPVVSNQPPYSMLRRDIEENLLDYCRDKNIGIVAYSPMQKGLLTGKYSKETIDALPEDDHRHNDSRFKEPQLSINLELVKGLKKVAEKNGKTCAQLALAWVLSKEEITSAITGTRKASQIEETVEAGNWELSDEIIGELDRLLEEREQKLKEIG